MAVFCIIHELNNTLKNYKPFYEALRSTGVYWNVADNISFIQSDKDASFIRDILTTYTTQNDRVFVIEVKKHWAGLGYKHSEYDWLKQIVK